MISNKMYQYELYRYISKLSCNYNNCLNINQHSIFFNAESFITDNA